MRQRIVAAGLVVGLAGLLSGCGAEVRPLAAVRMNAAGRPEAVLRPCGDDPIQGLSLTGWRDDGDGERNLSGWEVPGRRPGADAEFPLFSPPPAWRAEAVGQQEPVSGLTYQLGFGKADSDYEYTGAVVFRPADLRRLRPGQVWADDRVMSLGEFEGLAEDSC